MTRPVDRPVDPLILEFAIFVAIFTLVAAYLARAASRGNRSLRNAWLIITLVAALATGANGLRQGDSWLQLPILVLLPVPVTGFMAFTAWGLHRASRNVVMRTLATSVAGMAMYFLLVILLVRI